MKLYQAFDVDEETPVQWLAVHPLRWQEHWGEPAIMFREVDDKTQAMADAAAGMFDVLNQARQELAHTVPDDCWSTGPLTGDVIQDHITCPGCAVIDRIDAILTQAGWKEGDQ